MPAHPVCGCLFIKKEPYRRQQAPNWKTSTLAISRRNWQTHLRIRSSVLTEWLEDIGLDNYYNGNQPSLMTRHEPELKIASSRSGSQRRENVLRFVGTGSKRSPRWRILRQDKTSISHSQEICIQADTS